MPVLVVLVAPEYWSSHSSGLGLTRQTYAMKLQALGQHGTFEHRVLMFHLEDLNNKWNTVPAQQGS